MRTTGADWASMTPMSPTVARIACWRRHSRGEAGSRSPSASVSTSMRAPTTSAFRSSVRLTGTATQISATCQPSHLRGWHRPSAVLLRGDASDDLRLLKFAQGIAGDPARGPIVELEQRFRFSDRRVAERAIALADLAERPVDCLLDLVAVVGRRGPDQRQVREVGGIGLLTMTDREAREHRERAPFREPVAWGAPRAERPDRVAGGVDEIP